MDRIFWKEIFYSLCVLAYAAGSFFLALAGEAKGLAGFVIAGALSLVFLKLDSFKQFSGGGFSATLNQRVDRVERDIAPIKSKETEPDEPTDTDMPAEKFALNEDAEKVLFSLINSKYSWRTLTGLNADTGFSREKLKTVLQDLKQDGLVTKSNSSSGKEIWGASDKGYLVDSYHYPGHGRREA